MKATQAVRRKAKQRPAETTTGVAAAVVTVILWVFQIDPPANVVGALILLVGAIPAVVSWLVSRS